MLDAASSSTTTNVRPLNLEHGQLFFGYPVVPYNPPSTSNTTTDSKSQHGIGLSVMDSLRGGNTLSGRPTREATPSGTPRGSAGTPLPGANDSLIEKDEGEVKEGGEHDWRSGQRLGSARSSRPQGEKRKKKREAID